jgi:hypothetical protein
MDAQLSIHGETLVLQHALRARIGSGTRISDRRGRE